MRTHYITKAAAKKAYRSLFLFSLLIAATANAQVFKCTDNQGKITFSGVPCAGDVQVDEVEIYQSNVSGTPHVYDEYNEYNEYSYPQERKQYERVAEERPTAIVIGQNPDDINKQRREKKLRDEICQEAKSLPPGQGLRKLSERKQAMKHACDNGASYSEILQISLEYKKAQPAVINPTVIIHNY